MSAPSTHTPAYRLDRPSAPAVATLNGVDDDPGRHDTPESRAEYDRPIAEGLAPPILDGLSIVVGVAVWVSLMSGIRPSTLPMTSDYLRFFALQLAPVTASSARANSADGRHGTWIFVALTLWVLTRHPEACLSGACVSPTLLVTCHIRFSSPSLSRVGRARASSPAPPCVRICFL